MKNKLVFPISIVIVTCVIGIVYYLSVQIPMKQRQELMLEQAKIEYEMKKLSIESNKAESTPIASPTPIPTNNNTRLIKCFNDVEAERSNVVEQVLAWKRENPQQASMADLNQVDQLYKDKKQDCISLYK